MSGVKKIIVLAALLLALTPVVAAEIPELSNYSWLTCTFCNADKVSTAPGPGAWQDVTGPTCNAIPMQNNFIYWPDLSALDGAHYRFSTTVCADAPVNLINLSIRHDNNVSLYVDDVKVFESNKCTTGVQGCSDPVEAINKIVVPKGCHNITIYLFNINQTTPPCNQNDANPANISVESPLNLSKAPGVVLMNSGGAPTTQCGIEGAARVSGTANPKNYCQICNPPASVVEWTPMGILTVCGDGLICSKNALCQAGACSPARTDGELAEQNKMCLPSSGCYAETRRLLVGVAGGQANSQCFTSPTSDMCVYAYFEQDGRTGPGLETNPFTAYPTGSGTGHVYIRYTFYPLDGGGEYIKISTNDSTKLDLLNVFGDAVRWSKAGSDLFVYAENKKMDLIIKADPKALGAAKTTLQYGAPSSILYSFIQITGKPKVATCGNGVCESNPALFDNPEDSQNCCQDCACGTGHVCLGGVETNLVKNQGFDAAFMGNWTGGALATPSPAPPWPPVLNLSAPSFVNTSRAVPVLSSTTYNLSAWVMNASSSAKLWVGVRDLKGLSAYGVLEDLGACNFTSTGGAAWAPFSCLFTTKSSTRAVNLSIWSEAGAFWVDNVSLRPANPAQSFACVSAEQGSRPVVGCPYVVRPNAALNGLETTIPNNVLSFYINSQPADSSCLNFTTGDYPCVWSLLSDHGSQDCFDYDQLNSNISVDRTKSACNVKEGFTPVDPAIGLVTSGKLKFLCPSLSSEPAYLTLNVFNSSLPVSRPSCAINSTITCPPSNAGCEINNTAARGPFSTNLSIQFTNLPSGTQAALVKCNATDAGLTVGINSTGAAWRLCGPQFYPSTLQNMTVTAGASVPIASCQLSVIDSVELVPPFISLSIASTSLPLPYGSNYTNSSNVSLSLNYHDGLGESWFDYLSACKFANSQAGLSTASWESCYNTTPINPPNAVTGFRYWLLDAASDGNKTVWVRIRDLAGNENTTNASIFLDRVPPTVSISPVPMPFLCTGSPCDCVNSTSVYATVSDPAPGSDGYVSAVEYKNASLPWTPLVVGTTQVLPDASYDLRVRATDWAGNVGTWVIYASGLTTTPGTPTPSPPCTIKIQ